MSTTLSSIANISASNDPRAFYKPAGMGGVDMLTPDSARHVLVDNVSKADGSRESIYQFMAGDPAKPLTVRVGFYPKSNGTANISVKVMATATTQTGSEYSDQPMSVTIAYAGPNGSVIGHGDVVRLLGYAFSWLCPLQGLELAATLENSETVGAVLDQLQFGLTGGILTVLEVPAA